MMAAVLVAGTSGSLVTWLGSTAHTQQRLPGPQRTGPSRAGGERAPGPS